LAPGPNFIICKVQVSSTLCAVYLEETTGSKIYKRLRSELNFLDRIFSYRNDST
jgi:hypothetical protein